MENIKSIESTENTENTKSVEDLSKFWRDYQEKAWSTCLPSCQNWDYLVLGLYSEIGELCGKFKKKIRGDYDDCPEMFLVDVKAEIGDILWYIFGILHVKNAFFSSEVLCTVYNETVTLDASLLGNSTMTGSLSFLLYDAKTLLSQINYCIIPATYVSSRMLNTIALIARSLGFSIEEAATANIEKLAKRYNTGKIMGSGDYR